MAALLIVAGAMVHDKIKTKKEMKRRRVLDDERERRRQVQAEMNRKETQTAVQRNYDSEDEKEDESLPRYEDVVTNGEGISSSNGSGSSSGIQNTSDAPPEYGRRSVESRRTPGV